MGLGRSTLGMSKSTSLCLVIVTLALHWIKGTHPDTESMQLRSNYQSTNALLRVIPNGVGIGLHDFS